MSTRESIKASLEDHFAFLQSKGFQIPSFEYYEKSFGNWEMTFQSKECVMQVYRERNGDIAIVFKPIIFSENKWFGLETLIYFISEEKDYIGLFGGEWSDMKGQLNRFTDILTRYLDDILLLFEKDFAQTSNAIKEKGIENMLFNLSKEEYKKRRRAY